MSNRTLAITDDIYRYMMAVSSRESEVLAELRQETQKLAYRTAQISPEQGQFMTLLVKLLAVRKAIEIGTFTGYSAICVAAAMPLDGKLIACDVNAEWTDIAKQFWHKAGIAHKIELHLQSALITLDTLIANQEAGSFDLVFIDADKSNYQNYYERALILLRQGGLILIDNVLWYGKVADNTVNDKDTLALRALNEFLHTDDRVDIAMLPIGDGLTLARKK